MYVEENKAVIRAWLAARQAHDVEAGVALWRKIGRNGCEMPSMASAKDSLTYRLPLCGR